MYRSVVVVLGSSKDDGRFALVDPVGADELLDARRARPRPYHAIDIRPHRRGAALVADAKYVLQNLAPRSLVQAIRSAGIAPGDGLRIGPAEPVRAGRRIEAIGVENREVGLHRGEDASIRGADAVRRAPELIR